MDWLPNPKTVRDNEVKASEESDEVQALKAKLERARVVKEKFKSWWITFENQHQRLGSLRKIKGYMEVRGIEPRASRMRSERSTI